MTVSSIASFMATNDPLMSHVTVEIIIKLVSGAFLSSNKGTLTREYQKDKISAPFKIDSKCLAPPSISWPFLIRRVPKFSLVSESFCPVSKFVLFLLVNNLSKIFVLPPPCQSLSWRSYSPISIAYYSIYVHKNVAL